MSDIFLIDRILTPFLAAFGFASELGDRQYITFAMQSSFQQQFAVFVVDVPKWQRGV
jgi:hypothetical protein